MSLFRDAQLTRKQTIMTIVLVAGAFISVLNQTIVSPALPGIMSELGVDVSTAQWLITIFTLVMAIMIPVTAYLLDRFSIRTLYIFAMALFAIGSLLLAWGPVFSVLILGRVLQAISSGMLSPMIMSILMWIFPLGFRGRAMGLYSLVVAFAPAIGPTYSGVMVDLVSWHFVFLSIAPLAVIAAVIAFFTIEDFGERRSVTLDKLSLILSTFGLASLLYGCSIIGSAGGLSTESVGAIAAGLLILVLFGLRQLSLEKPMLELRVLKNRKFLSAASIIMLFQAAILVLSVILPIYIQTVLGYSATMTGLVFLPGAVFMAGMSMVSGRLFDRHGPRKPVLMGAAALVISFLGLVILDAGSSVWLVFICYAISGGGIALLNTPLSTWALNSLDDKEVHHGSAVLNTLRQAAGAIGTALLVTVMSIAMSAYPDPDSIAANMAGFNATSVCMAAIMIVLFMLAFFLVHDTKLAGN
ncbi:MDR family MFS transporter [Methanogenium organophilum]|uniref:MDR family MFS transporter n=1 Tax=Methanogenium organophilum TaxID=2199 RepID=A0A9X9S1Y0_METOG|nr:MDR family MFS transporter [Methanogenium organophilum]WAI00332.1 MDR family MFS transporter [Methanogenium organophilum]